MKTSILIGGMVLGVAAFALATTNDITTVLQRGLFEEEANRNLDAAITAYQSVAAQFDKDRKLAATAVFRLGECYRKQGDTNRAAGQYERVLRDFSDQPQLVTLSRQNLVGLGAATETPDLAEAAIVTRLQAKRLLEDEISRVTTKLHRLENKVSAGTEPKSALDDPQRELLDLKRQLAALDARRSTMAAAADGTASAPAAARLQQKRLLEEEIKLVEQKLDLQKKMIENGTMSPDGLWDTQRQILELKRQIAALDAGQPTLMASTDATAAAATAESVALEAQLAELNKLPKGKLRLAVQQEFPNPVLTSLVLKLAETDQHLAGLQRDYGPQHAEVLKAGALKENINRQIDEQVEAVLRGLEIKVNVAKKTAEALQAQAGSAAPKKPAAEGSAGVAPTANEAEEVRRIQALIKDSPDLINAKDATGGAYTPLHLAANRGQLVVAQFLLANGAEVDAKNSSNETPLHVAARGGHKAMVELLLSHKANVQATDNNWQTPLHMAAGNGFRSVVEVLLEHGADVNAKTGSGAAALLMATANGFRSVAELLLAHGADANTSTTDVRSSDQRVQYAGPPLEVAASRGDLAMVNLLLTNKADVSLADPYGNTALHLAARNKDLAVASALLAHGADVNARIVSGDHKGWTPLHEATAYHQKEMMALLLKNQADPNARTDSINGDIGRGYTPLLTATRSGTPEDVELLLSAKADPNLGTQNDTPLLNAMRFTEPAVRLQMLKSLLAHGAAVDARTSDGNTALLLAAVTNDKDAMALLLANKAEVNAKSNNGFSALHSLAYLSSERDVKPLVEMLLKAGADTNMRDAAGETPLHFAVNRRNREVIELLLANKADPNARDNQGHTPLEEAERQGPQLAGGFTRLPSAGVPLPPQAVYVGQPGMPTTVQVGMTSPGAGPSQPAPASATNIADLLRQHGATRDLPRPDRIEVRRPSAGYSATVFVQGTNDWNQFSLLELIAAYYRILAPSPGTAQGSSYDPMPFFLEFGESLPFPDFAKLRIRRPAPDGKSWQEQAVDFWPLLRGGDCSKDVRLRWGDVVDIPEADHRLAQVWGGFATTDLANLKQCLSRQVEVVIKGQTTNITLAPWIIFREGRNTGTLRPDTSFWIEPALRASGLLLASSDLSRVTVIRGNPAKGAVNKWVIDCSEGKPAPDFWLMNGDRVEVPERTN